MPVGYFIKEAFTNFKRGGIASYAACGTITTTLIIVGIFLFITFNLKTAITTLAERTSLVVYLKDTITESQRNSLQKEISRISRIAELTYISKEKALQQFREDLKALNKEEILEGLPRNPLPDSFEVKLKTDVGFSWVDFEQTAEIITKLPYVASVDYGQRVVTFFTQITQFLKLIILSITIILSLATLVIIIDTIELTLFAREQEIFLLRIVGAEYGFIRWPYLLEGALQGLISGILAILMLFGAYKFVINEFNLESTFLIFPLRFLPIEASIALVITSISIGILGSFISVQIFLKQSKKV